MKLTSEDILACEGLPLAIDTETTGLFYYKDGLIGIGIHCPKANVSGYVHTCFYEEAPFGKPKKREVFKGEMDYSKSTRGRKIKEVTWEPDTAMFARPDRIRAEHFLKAVHQIAQNPNTTLIGHNLKFDAHFLGLRLWELPCKILDTAVIAHLLDSRQKKSLDAIESTYLGTRSKRSHVAQADKRFSKSPWMWGEKVLEDYCTNDCVVTYQLAETLMPKIREMDLNKLLTLQMKYLRLLQKVEWRGIRLEEHFCHQAIQEFEKNIGELEAELFDIIGYEFNWRSPQQLSQALYDNFGLSKPVNPFPEGAKNATAKMYTDSATGTPLLLKTKHPLHKEVIVLRETAKLKEYAEKYLEFKSDEGCIHASFNITGTVTGRLSCVSGDTILHTSRGDFRFDEYVLQAGDLTITHTGSWKPILRKIFKGYSPMFRVCLSNGSMLKCTQEHQVLTPNGWKKLGELTLGDKVYSYGDIKKLHTESRQYQHSFRSLSQQPREAHYQADSGTIGSNLSQCDGYNQYQCSQGEVESRTSSPLFKVETVGQKCYARKDREETSQLQRSNRRWTWLFNAESQREIYSRTPQSVCRIHWSGEYSFGISSSSHRWGSTQQRYSQSGFDDRQRSFQTPFEREICTITKIIPLGEMGVWDITVSGDESYLAQGFINHNSSSPNLQQLPSANRKYDLDSEYTGGSHRTGGYNLRQALCARPGYKIVSIDHKQQEARLLAILSQEPDMLQFMADRKDIHLEIAVRIWGDCGKDQNKLHRDWSKAFLFGTVYGMSEDSLQEHFQKLGIEADAYQVRSQFFSTFPKLEAWFEEIVQQIEEDGGIRYWSGRYWFPEYMSEAYKGVNAIIQGGSGDFLSLVLVRANQVLEAQGWGYLISIIHDEALFEIKEEYVAEAAPVLARIFESEDVFGVPFLADIEVGDSYGALEPLVTDVDISKIDWQEYLNPVLA